MGMIAKYCTPVSQVEYQLRCTEGMHALPFTVQGVSTQCWI